MLHQDASASDEGTDESDADLLFGSDDEHESDPRILAAVAAATSSQSEKRATRAPAPEAKRQAGVKAAHKRKAGQEAAVASQTQPPKSKKQVK
jgi:hypothetical protein